MEDTELKQIELIRTYWANKNLPMDTYSGYSEPGYEAKKDIVFVGNWNNYPQKFVNWLESNYDVEWEDEWMSCSNCGKLIRTQGNSYSWKPSYEIGDGAIYCRDCIDEEEYINSLIDKPEKVNVFDDIDLKQFGFENLNGTFENGLHQGMNDDPKEIIKEYKEKFPEKEFIFNNLETSQFYITFEVWGRDKKKEDQPEEEDSVDDERDRKMNPPDIKTWEEAYDFIIKKTPTNDEYLDVYLDWLRDNDFVPADACLSGYEEYLKNHGY